MTYKLNPFTGKLDTSDGPQGPAGVVSAAGPGSQGTPSISFAADLDTGLYNYTANGIAVSTNGTGRLFIDASGKVGLGATVPLTKLHLADASSPAILVQDTTNNVQALFGSLDSFAQGGTGTNHDFRILTNNTERLRITSDGKVGLGTSSPSELLHVLGGNIRLSGSAGVAQTVFREINFNNISTTASPGVKIVATTGGNTSDHELAFYTTTDNAVNTTEKVRISHNGNVGIGTTSPAASVHTAGSLRVQSDLELADSGNTVRGYIFGSSSGNTYRVVGATSHIWQYNNGTNEAARIDSSGRLLVGTSTTVSIAGSSAFIQQHGNKTTCNLALVGYANNAGGPILAFGASRSTTVGTAGTIVSSGDYLGEIRFAGDDGTDINTTGASIHAQVDGTPGTDDMPGRLVFSTTADGASSPTERMWIQSDGKIRLTNGVIYASNVSRSGISLGGNAWIPTDNTGTNSDNTVSVGTASVRMSVIYAATGTINTSDANLKQDIGDLDAAELSVATAIRGLIRRYRFKDAVEAKGDNARIHVGVVAQEVEQAFVDSGLDPRRYALFCEDELEDGTKRLGIRYDELLAFVIAAL